MIYVVRADGKELYADSGSLPGDRLHTVLKVTLAQSGRQFSDAEATLLVSSVKAAEEASAKSDTVAMGQALSALSKIGPAGKLNSFAESGIRADELYDEFAKSIGDEVEKAIALTEQAGSEFQGVLKLVELESAVKNFPELRKVISPAIVKLRKDSKTRDWIKPSEAIARARQSASSSVASVKRRAESAYASVAKKYAGTAAGDLAKEELLALNPDADLAPTTPAGDSDQAVRKWASQDGKFTLAAALVSADDRSVKLKKADGSVVDVPIAALSEADRKHIALWRELFE